MTKQIKADFSLLFITAVWGLSFPLMKNVLEHIPSFAYLSMRFAIASAVLIAVFNKKLMPVKKKALVYGCITGLMLFGGMALQVSGLYFTTASRSAFITGLNVIMVPPVSAVILKKRPDISSVIGVLLAVVGLFFLTGGLSLDFNLGDFLTLLCAVCFTFHIILIDRFTREYGPELLSTLQVTAAALFFTLVWLFIDRRPVSIDATVVYTLLFTGVLGTALAFAIQTAAQKFTQPTHTALILTAEPVFGAVFAMLIPNSRGRVETLAPHTIVGCLLILAAMIICEIGAGKIRRRQNLAQ